MLFFDKKGVELLHLMSEQEKGIPIMKAFEFNAQNYKYGKEVYFDLIKKQIDDAFEITRHYVSNNVKGGGFDEYLALLAQDPESKAEIKALNELLEYLQSDITQKEQAPEPQRKPGRPKAVIHEASFYLKNKKLLQFLIDNYSNVKPKVFNQLLSVLSDTEINQLKPATNKEYNEAFGKALNVKQKQSNFDNYFNTTKTPMIKRTFEPIKANIKTYLEQ